MVILVLVVCAGCLCLRLVFSQADPLQNMGFFLVVSEKNTQLFALFNIERNFCP